MPELSRQALNRVLLARQGLLEREAAGLAACLEQVGGLQAQYAPAMYLGLFSRLAGFERDALTRALEAREVLQGTLMRATIHLVAPADYWPFAVAVRDARRRLWTRSRPDAPAAPAMAGAARRLRHALAAGPLYRRDVEALLGRPAAAGVGLWVDLLRVPPLGTWDRRRADRYALADAEVGPPPEGLTPARATDHLVRRYLQAFGPAGRHDIASFTGLRVGDLAGPLGRLGLVTYRGPDGQALLDVPDGRLPDPGSSAPPRFLPVWDATLLVHARRTGVLPEELRPRVFSTRKPHGTATFLVDGQVAGEWRLDAGRVALEPYGRLDPAARRELEVEAERLAAFAA